MRSPAAAEEEGVKPLLKEVPSCPKCKSELVTPFFDGTRQVIQCANCGYFGAPRMGPGKVMV